MRDKIHPNYHEIQVQCTCGNSFRTRSTADKKDLSIEVCSECHPFYTGKQKTVDAGGRVDKFKQRYAQKPAVAKPAAPAKTGKAEEKKAAKPAVKTKATAAKKKS